MSLFNFGKSAPAEPVTPEAPAALAATATPPAPEPKGLDKFSFLLDNKGDSSKKPAEGTDPEPDFDPVNLLNNEEALQGLMSKIDFSSSISKTTQEKLSSNAPDALVALVNDVAKAAYRTSMQHSSALNKRYVEGVLSKKDAEVSSKINSHINDRELAAMLPEVTNPVVALGINPLVQQMRKQNPSMSTADIASQVKEYLQELNATVNPAKPAAKDKSKEDIDWFAELGL